MNIYPLIGKIDSNNAPIIEEKINQYIKDNQLDNIILDCNELLYISSAGLRIILRLNKILKDIKLINVNNEVYEILNITGLSEFIKVDKVLRKINIDGANIIGEGAHGIVYKIADDTIVKVYRPNTPIERIRKEISLARWAFIRGIPTAIPYDIVEVDDKYGAVFELINAKSTIDYINASKENLEEFVRKSVILLKQIHSIEVNDDEFPDMKLNTIDWFNNIKDKFNEDEINKINNIINNIEDSHTLIHADYHLKNILICDDELMLIDMDTLSKGDPIFDLATIFNSYYEFPTIDKNAATFLGIDVNTAYEILDKTFSFYLDNKNIEEIKERAQLLGCIRIINYMNKYEDENIKNMVIEACLKDMKDIIKER